MGGGGFPFMVTHIHWVGVVPEGVLGLILIGAFGVREVLAEQSL